MESVGRERNERGPESGRGVQDERERNVDETDRMDNVFGVLSNRRRRRVIEYLREGDGTATVGELAEHIASEEDGTPVRQLSSSDRKRVYVSLYQNHLPVMEEASVIGYDENRETVRLLDGAAKLEPYLDDRGEASGRRRRRRLSVGAAVVVSAVVLLGALRVGPFGAVPPEAWTVLGLAGLLCVACVELDTHVR